MFLWSGYFSIKSEVTPALTCLLLPEVRHNQSIRMADGGFDPCECIFNHEMAMRRLLSLLRSSQTTCTDNECFQDGLPGPDGANGGTSHLNHPNVVNNICITAASPDNFMMIMIGWMLMAMMMYFMRPSSMRNNSTEGKPQGTFHFIMNIMIHPKQLLLEAVKENSSHTLLYDNKPDLNNFKLVHILE